MSVLGAIIDAAAALKSRVEAVRLERRWAKLRQMGMLIGRGVRFLTPHRLTRATVF
jgi:hypothetical protein